MTRLVPLFGLLLVACPTPRHDAPGPATLGDPASSERAAPPSSESAVTDPPLHPDLAAHIVTWLDQAPPPTIDADRRLGFDPLAAWIADREVTGRPAELIFVCTHNSRRSHMAQLWAQAAAEHLGLDQVRAASGGTEATAFNPRSVRALSAHGFDIEDTGELREPGNVVYSTSLGPDLAPLPGFSKTFGDPSNPQEDFAAVMVCSDADASCPFVPGADLRVSVTYLDPKVSDGTPEEAATYLAKSEEIGREMAWLMAEARRLADAAREHAP